jgi:hypothetical protein
MKSKLGGAVLFVAMFAGCAADDGVGANGAEAVEARTDTATQAAPPCPSVTESLNDAVLHGRATKTVTPFFIWQLTAFYAVRAPGSTMAQEYLGAEGTQGVTLYAANDVTTSWTANAALCVDTPLCGDGIRNVSSIAEEPCEGADLGGQTCASQGFSGGGTLRCKSSCLFDTEQCQGTCGNGRVDGRENCDRTSFGNIKTCTDLKPWLYVGGALKCEADCLNYDESGCLRSTCGNGILEVGEECDGANLGTVTTCAQKDIAYKSGNLKCNGECKLDVSQCVLECGDGILQPDEPCDGNLWNAKYASKLCKDQVFPYSVFPWNVTLNYASGNLACRFCGVDFDACKPTSGCYLQSTGHAGAALQCY